MKEDCFEIFEHVWVALAAECLRSRRAQQLWGKNFYPRFRPLAAIYFRFGYLSVRQCALRRRTTNTNFGEVIRLRLFRTILIIAFLFAAAFAVQGAYAQSFRAYAGEFLGLGVGARSLALGGSTVAISDDVTAGYWNPAGLTSIDYPTFGAMHEARFDNTVQYNYGAFALPIGASSTIALSVLQIGIDNIKDTRSAWIDLNHDGIFNGEDYVDYTKVTSFGNHDWTVLLSYAKKYDSLNTFSYGATAKFVMRKLDEENSATGLGVDIGVRYSPMPHVELGAVARDITTTLLSYTSGTKELVAPSLDMSGAYYWFVSSDGFHKIIPTAQLDMRFDNLGSVAPVHVGPISLNYHLGAEYQFGTLFAIRAGYNDMKQISVGAGISLPKLHLDYSFLSFSQQDQLGNTHRISFAFTLESPKSKRPE